MTEIYDRFREAAYRLVERFGGGRTATFYHTTTTFDPLTGAETSVETSFQSIAVTPPRSGAITTPFGEVLEQENSITVVIPAIDDDGAAHPFTPAPGDHVVVPMRPARYAIQDCSPKDPDGDPIAFVLRAAKLGT